MPPRSLSGLSERSPICVSRWDDASCGSSVESTGKSKGKGSIPLVRSVAFADHNEVFEITHLQDMPAEDVAATWYDAGEYADIKKSYQLTIFLMESGEKLVEDDEHTSRGLEYRTQEGAWARYENKRDAYNAVLDEQDRQWKKDKDDWQSISKVYIEHSEKCQKAAYERASKDELDIAEYIRINLIEEKKLKKKSTSSSTGKRKKTERRSSSSSESSEPQQLQEEESSSRRTEVRNDIKRESQKKSSKSLKEKRQSV